MIEGRNIGRNIIFSQEEKMEDLLEILYLWWRDGRRITSPALSREEGLSRRQVTTLCRQMISCGYLSEDGGCYRLTEFGKVQGGKCRARHLRLAQFLQMICGLDKAQAERDACRIEHVISDEAVNGIAQFMKYGRTSDLTICDTDLRFLYEDGVHPVRIGIYCRERRRPRVLAAENQHVRPEASLIISAEKSMLCLYTDDLQGKVQLWFRCREAWHRAEYIAGTWSLPLKVLTFVISAAVPVIEGQAVVACTSAGTAPEAADGRELNVHLWQRRRYYGQQL